MSAAAVLLCLIAVAAGTGGGQGKEHKSPPDTLRYPYSEGAVYRVRLVPGAPFIVELPSGEAVEKVWIDRQYWKAEYTEDSSRVVVRALAATDIVGRKGLVHIETKPSKLRISLRVEAVTAMEDVPAALQIYAEGTAAADPIKNQVRQAVDAELLLARRRAVQEERAKFEAWKVATLSHLRSTYESGGDFLIMRVVDNGLQTYITVPDGSDKAVLQVVDRGGKAEMVNYEFDPKTGVYTVENKVLRRGEKFRLVIGKEKAWIALR
jgi:Conjugal transfer protein